MIREQKNVIFFIRTDSFVALQSFSFLKAYASEDREEDNEIEGGGGRKSFYQKPETQNGRAIRKQKQSERLTVKGGPNLPLLVRSFIKISKYE